MRLSGQENNPQVYCENNAQEGKRGKSMDGNVK